MKLALLCLVFPLTPLLGLRPARAVGLAMVSGRAPSSELAESDAGRGQAQQMLMATPGSAHSSQLAGEHLPGLVAFHACRDSEGAFFDARVDSTGSMGCDHEDNGWNRTSSIAGGAIALPIGK